jgi:hypothetical protein
LFSVILTLGTASAESPNVRPVPSDYDWRAYSEPSYFLDSRPDWRDGDSDLRLVGFWEHRDDHLVVMLEVISENRLVISGHEFEYNLTPGAIRLKDASGEFDYPYQLSGDQLILSLSDDDESPQKISFRRMSISDHYESSAGGLNQR